MPTIYLSPSTQEFNNYVDGSGSEEYYMNLIADAMIPYLDASGIGYVRNTKDMTAASSIAASNSGNYDFHLALHSNAAGEANSGKVRGTEVYYYPRSNNGQRAAEIIANNMKLIYPLPELVRTVPTETLGEVVRTVLSLTDYFDIPFNYPQNTFMGTIVTPLGGSLNIRKSPSFNAPVIGSVPSGQNVTILASLPDWYLIRYNNTIGYSYAPYVK